MAAPEPVNMQASNLTFQLSCSGQASSSSASSAEAPLPATSSFAAGPSAPPQPTSSAPSPVRLPEHLMHKNRLQEYTQRSNIRLPIYRTVNEGLAHAPRFRSTVWVDGKSYTSQNVFPIRKAAEQDAAKLAFERISAEIKDEGFPPIFEKTMFFKSILNEYAAKMNLEKITYDTVKREGLPVFISSLVFNGKRYTGDPAKSKKEAEQLAARVAIRSNLGNSVSGTRLSEIIKSKFKLCTAIKNVKDSKDTSTVSPTENTGHTSVSAAPVGANNNAIHVAPPECSRRVLPPQQEFQMPKQDISPEGSKLPNVSLQVGAQQHIVDSSSSRLKKRKKNKKKANKKSRLDPLPPVPAQPFNQIPPSSAALPLNQVPPSAALPLNQFSPSAALPLNQFSPSAALPLSQVPPSSAALPLNQVPPSSKATPLIEVPPFSVAEQ